MGPPTRKRFRALAVRHTATVGSRFPKVRSRCAGGGSGRNGRSQLEKRLRDKSSARHAADPSSPVNPAHAHTHTRRAQTLSFSRWSVA